MKPVPANSANKLSSLENIAKLAPIFTVSILAISITFDSAYLWALGLSLGDIPSSISEHIRSALLWSPIIFVFLLIVGSIFLLEDTSTNYKKLESDDPIVKVFMGKGGTIAYIATTLFLIYLTYETRNYIIVFAIFIAIWTQILTRFSSLRAKNNLSISIQMRCFLTIPIILSIVGFVGYFLGNKLLTSNNLKWEYTVKKDDEEVILNVFGQRRFTEFTIAIINDKKILIIPNSHILSTKSL